MNSLCITTLVDKRYWEYVELFTWCCKRAYPEYDVKILKKEELFPGYPDRGYTTNALRFLTGAAPYEGYSFIYITDIDIMILREKPTLLNFHQMDMRGCFSNSIRGSSNKFSFKNETWTGHESLSGLHFCSREWFDHIEPQAKKYRELLKTAEVGRGFDGHMLYKMCKELGWPIPGKKKLIKRHHGIHLGTFRLWGEGKPLINRPERAGVPMSKDSADSAIRKRVKPWKINRWLKIMADPEYAAIKKRIHNTEILGILKKLEDFCLCQCQAPAS